MGIVDLILLWWLSAWAYEAFVENVEPSARLKLSVYVSAFWYYLFDVAPAAVEWSRSF